MLRKMYNSGRLLILGVVALLCLVQSSILFGQTSIVLPGKAQLRWQQYEQTMFVALDPCTWQGREYDNHSWPLSRINPSKLNTDQWCETARLWGAKLILFVAKHTGGFCWWQTETSNYGIKDTPWRNGKGDVLADLSKSCKKYGLDLGVYVYPGDEQWGAGIGSGGKTNDSSKQEAYNQVYRKQLIEVLSRYGTIREVWFDGNCVVPVDDIISTYAPDAVIFQGKMASIRWVGNEDGIAPYPNWYTLQKADLTSGGATALHSDPNGDVYAPVEIDVPLLKNKGHKWFWAPNTDSLLLTLPQLMDLYYKSVGRGAVLLLNATPDTTGLIPASHVAVYRQFGEELKSRFSTPVKKTPGQGGVLEMNLGKTTQINHVILQEELSKGQRVQAYVIEGFNQGNWIKVCEGSSIGSKRIDYFKTAQFDKVRVRFLKYKATPQISNFSVYFIPVRVSSTGEGQSSDVISSWQADTYGEDWKEVRFDLTPYMNAIGQYEIYFEPLVRDFNSREPSGLEFSDWQLQLYGRDASESIQQLAGKNGFRITRSQQTLSEFPSVLKVKIRSKPARSAGDIVLKRITY